MSFINFSLSRARGVAWSSIPALGAGDPGSNPGGPTIIPNGNIRKRTVLYTKILIIDEKRNIINKEVVFRKIQMLQ